MNPEEALLLAEYFRQHPVEHIQQIQGVESLEPYQINKIILPILHNERVAIRACHNVGKTFTISKLVLFFGSCFPGSKIITTAPSATLVRKLLWSEIRSGFRRAKFPLGGKMLEIEWKIGDDWFAIGMSPDDGEESDDGSQGQTSNFQGFHVPDGGMLVVVFDEATGVRTKRWIQAEGMMTQQNVRWIAIGNPTSPSAEFSRCFKDPAWFKSHISCFDSPNLPANGFLDVNDVAAEVATLSRLSDAAVQERMKSYKVVNSYLLTAKWVISLALRRGVDSPIFISKALGDIPDLDDHVLIPLSVVERSQRRVYLPTELDERHFGVDVAREGADETVITQIDGWKVTDKRVLSKLDGELVAGEVIQMVLALARRRKESILIDGTGVGASVLDFLRKALREKVLPQHIKIFDIQFGAVAEKYVDQNDEEAIKEAKKLYANVKAQMFDLLAKDMKSSLCIPDELIYQEELPGIKYSFDDKGRYVLESKKKYKKRTGLGSPDNADSLALANFGRHVSDLIGSFSEEIKSTTQRSRPRASSLKSGDQW